MEIGLSLGSNLGDRASALNITTEAIISFTKTTIVESSPIYETDPSMFQPNMNTFLS